MLQLLNHTPWQAGMFSGWGLDGRHHYTAVVKANFRFSADGSLQPDAAALPLEVADRHASTPHGSSLAAAADSVPFKQGGEFFLSGTAWAPADGSRQQPVRVAVHRDDQLLCEKILVVHGPRKWVRRALNVAPVYEGEFEALPISYEAAYGGSRAGGVYEANPVGCGYLTKHDDSEGRPLPRIEYADQGITSPADRPAPAGFGPIPRFWQPRRGLLEAGAEGLIELDSPFVEHAHPAMHNAAPADQQLPAGFAGGEVFSITGLHCPVAQGEAAEVRLALPRLPLHAVMIRSGGEREPITGCCDTVAIDLNEAVLSLTWRWSAPWPLSETRPGWLELHSGEPA